jgi:hypothetical protein
VCTAIGDVELTVAASIEVPAKVVFLHPHHNFAIVQYDPSSLGDTPVQAALLSEEPAKVCCQIGGMVVCVARSQFPSTSRCLLVPVCVCVCAGVCVRV